MFRLNRKNKTRTYALESNGSKVQIPLSFEGKSIVLNEKRLPKGEYQWVTEKENKQTVLPIMVL
ncbi:hypothetical protein [Membranihabitans marinus]|uniref:hypothetical protein n=1 Tax=Membranihabitans marinus TaxID=1227546 RepID=UPI001F15952F|nr:hypothetical protein [Membranihabitans marinus]